MTFGYYEQDADLSNGPEPIEWLVLEYDAANNRALLLSRYGLDAKPYNKKSRGITCENCSLCAWLNNDFMNKAFNSTDREVILTMKVDNSSEQGYSGWGGNGGNNTQDKVFLLSFAEVHKYLGVNNTESPRRVAPTAYAINQGASTDFYKTADGQAAGWWWLRSPGGFQDTAAHVDNAGALNIGRVDLDGGCVRPALWVNLNSGTF